MEKNLYFVWMKNTQVLDCKCPRAAAAALGETSSLRLTISLVHWNSQSHSPFAESAQCFLTLIPNPAFLHTSWWQQKQALHAGMSLWSGCSARTTQCWGPSWEHSMAVSGKWPVWPHIHVKPTYVSIYILSVYRTAAGTKYVCFKDFIDFTISL